MLERLSIYREIFITTPLVKDLIQIILDYIISFEGTYVKTIGKQGTGPLEFKILNGLATDNKHIYVCDSENHRIQKIDKEGSFVSCFGSLGSGYGQFDWPGHLVIHNSLLYVSDQRNKRIQIFSLPDCLFNKEFRCQYKPWGICIYKSIIYVSFSNTYEIHKFTLDGKLIKSLKLKSQGSDRNDIFKNNYMIVHNHMLFLICSSRTICGTINKIMRISIEGETEADIPYEFKSPSCLMFHNNVMYVIDKQNMYQFDGDYNLINKKEFIHRASCILFCGDLCFISNWTHRQIIVYK